MENLELNDAPEEDAEVSISSMTDDEIKAELLDNGIKLHHKTGSAKLQETLAQVRAGTYEDHKKVSQAEVQQSTQQEAADREASVVQANPATKAPVTAGTKMTAEEEAANPRIIKDEDLTPEQKAMELIRIVVSPNDPLMASYPGLIFTVGSSRVNRGRMIKKFVPFNNEEGWHVPRIIYDQIRFAEMQKFKRQRNHNGEQVLVPYITKKFNVTVLPSLTRKELDALAAAQKARGDA